AERLRLGGVCGSSRGAERMGLRATGSSPVSAFAGPHLGKALPSADHAGSGAKLSSAGLGVLTRMLTLVCDDAGNLRSFCPQGFGCEARPARSSSRSHTPKRAANKGL